MQISRHTTIYAKQSHAPSWVSASVSVVIQHEQKGTQHGKEEAGHGDEAVFQGMDVHRRLLSKNRGNQS